jgi:hypothetical protein
MTTKTKSASPAKSGITVINVPNPDSLPLNVARVGIPIHWNWNTPSYPDFQLKFGKSNPFDDTQGATFSGGDDQPLWLVPKNPGRFQYKITHTKQDGSKFQTGPFALNVQPDIGPRRCPPVC